MSDYANVLVKTKKDVVITSQKIAIAQMIANDISRKDIAKKMKLSIRTVEMHVDSMRYLLGCDTTPALIAVLFRKGLIK